MQFKIKFVFENQTSLLSLTVSYCLSFPFLSLSLSVFSCLSPSLFFSLCFSLSLSLIMDSAHTRPIAVHNALNRCWRTISADQYVKSPTPRWGRGAGWSVLLSWGNCPGVKRNLCCVYVCVEENNKDNTTQFLVQISGGRSAIKQEEMCGSQPWEEKQNEET